MQTVGPYCFNNDEEIVGLLVDAGPTVAVKGSGVIHGADGESELLNGESTVDGL